MKFAGFQNLPDLLLLATMLSFVGGCGASDTADRESAAEAARRASCEKELGPVKVSVAIDPPRARLSDEPTLTLTLDYQQGVTVEKPPFGEAIGEFLIRDFHEPMPKVENGREVVQQVYTLEPTQTGDLRIWPIAVHFTDTREGGDGKEHKIETDTLTVEIASVLGDEAPSLGGLRPDAAPVALPGSPWPAVGATIAALVLVSAGGALWWFWRRRRRVELERPLTPEELARLELEQLLARNLAEEDVALFYVELTGVVRRYIERTTGVRAPEQTTEEFLRAISSRDAFAPDERRRLKSFLESADLVKFAAYRPRGEDVDEAVNRAKIFIGLNREMTEVAA